MLARGAHHESERAACEHAYTDQQHGHAEDARDGWLRGQERRSRTLGVVVRVGRGGRVPWSRPECEHTPRCSVGAHTLRGTHAPSRLRSGLACLTVRRVRPSAAAGIGTWAPGGVGVTASSARFMCALLHPPTSYSYTFSLSISPLPDFFSPFTDLSFLLESFPSGFCEK